MRDKPRKNVALPRIGTIVFHFDEIPSTNEYAKKLGAWGGAEGLVVLADVQTQGKGRLDRVWQSQRGGLYFSILLRPDLSSEGIQRLTLVAGIAVARALRRTYGAAAQLKWPNDVLVNGKKACGILTESSIVGGKVNFCVVGIGVNVNNRVPADIKEMATSLAKNAGKKLDLTVVFRHVLREFGLAYESFIENPESIIRQWSALSDTIGRDVEISTGDELLRGKAVGIARDGTLKLKTKNGRVAKILAGDCVYLR
jgi:BirA family biotin operon repressor/biotin-[acetyl-CoA-carboxylase] ligase